VFIQHLGEQYCYVTCMCNIIAFYATAKQVLILLLRWLDLGFISSAQMRPSVGNFNNGLSISQWTPHCRETHNRRGWGVNAAISPESSQTFPKTNLHSQSNVFHTHTALCTNMHTQPHTHNTHTTRTHDEYSNSSSTNSPYNLVIDSTISVQI